MMSQKVQMKINSKIDEIVEKAHKIVEETKIYSKEGLSPTQVRNLQNMANATDSIEALKNYIYYQMGRSRGREGQKEWLFGGFGKKLLRDLNELGSLLDLDMLNVGEEERKMAHMQAIRLYLGFLARYYTYKKEASGT